MMDKKEIDYEVTRLGGAALAELRNNVARRGKQIDEMVLIQDLFEAELISAESKLTTLAIESITLRRNN